MCCSVEPFIVGVLLTGSDPLGFITKTTEFKRTQTLLHSSLFIYGRDFPSARHLKSLDLTLTSTARNLVTHKKPSGGGGREKPNPHQGKGKGRGSGRRRRRRRREDGCHCLYKRLLILEISKRCTPSITYRQNDMTHHGGSLSSAKVKSRKRGRERRKESKKERKKERTKERTKERIRIVKKKKEEGVSCGFGSAWVTSSVL